MLVTSGKSQSLTKHNFPLHRAEKTFRNQSIKYKNTQLQSLLNGDSEFLLARRIGEFKNIQNIKIR
jgi:hypothetical protein